MSGSIERVEDLGSKSCKPHTKGEKPVHIVLVRERLSQLSGWKLSGKRIVKAFTFKNFYETIAFVNAVAYIANREDHHPDLEVGYKTCQVSYSSHDIGGLSLNDFICAAKIDRLSK